MVQWPIPTSLKELGGFLGFMGYHQRFFINYGVMASSSTRFLKKDMFPWSEETTATLEELKQVVAIVPILGLTRFQSPFCD